MTTLHILNKSPDHPRFLLCLQALAPTDQLLLIENAVLALAETQVSLPASILALSPDMEARGLTHERFRQYGIGFDDVVRLTTQIPRIISW